MMKDGDKVTARGIMNQVREPVVLELVYWNAFNNLPQPLIGV